jgi:hypothetical protein
VSSSAFRRPTWGSRFADSFGSCIGKNADRAALVALSDASGRPRLTMTVDPGGNPRIEFLDESGKVVREWR